jgi:hypothetical protein
MAIFQTWTSIKIWTFKQHLLFLQTWKAGWCILFGRHCGYPIR